MSGTKNRTAIAVVALALVAAVVFGALLQPAVDVVQAAPAAGPTPVSVTRPAGGIQVFEVWNDTPITADTTADCIDIGAASVLDAQFEIDQTTTNTVTLTSQWSINADLITDGVNFVTDNAADASDLVQVQKFGRYVCPKADVTNSNTVTVTLFIAAY